MDRRRFLAMPPALLLSAAVGASARLAPVPARRLPSGAMAPPIGLGTWLSFDVADDYPQIRRRQEVLRRFFAAGGGMIDSSPMYGHAEWLLGQLLPELAHQGRLLAATKVWTPFDRVGPDQLERSLALWGLPRFDVLLVHNLLNWRAHLPLLREWKAAGRVRDIGVSTSHGRMHDEVADLIRTESLDVIQITYNLADRRAEPVLELAAEHGVAVVINRPFDAGGLFRRVGRRRLPAWAAEFDCANWAQFFLKWVVSHPAVTCAIPATSNPEHMDENMGAGLGRLPDAEQRRRMLAHFERL